MEVENPTAHILTLQELRERECLLPGDAGLLKGGSYFIDPVALLKWAEPCSVTYCSELRTRLYSINPPQCRRLHVQMKMESSSLEQLVDSVKSELLAVKTEGDFLQQVSMSALQGNKKLQRKRRYEEEDSVEEKAMVHVDSLIDLDGSKVNSDSDNSESDSDLNRPETDSDSCSSKADSESEQPESDSESDRTETLSDSDGSETLSESDVTDTISELDTSENVPPLAMLVNVTGSDGSETATYSDSSDSDSD
ncbi:lisH domain-containing protein C1711.05-like [Polypterus senegalus]|uniref:lisH domain-containing protein C1711.05-like n=1 Tax=Polypterus senegalus TaxID=55291 RepID=UPI00196521E5|nr:lisH domain-containing protein C1711.05-like [Polypterus senegalus]